MVVAYDISDDEDRARLAAFLSHHGTRIQRSVFRCEVNQLDIDRFTLDCERFCDPDIDVLHLFRLCRACQDHSHTYGQALPDVTQWYYIL